MSEAFVTLATNDEYALGALTLAMSLKRVSTTKNIAIMITEGVSEEMRVVLSRIFSHVEMVSVLDSNDKVNLGLLERPELGVTFTKLHCWRLTQYTKAVFMDADTLVLQNIDEIFEREELSASPDPGWPDCFNSGVFVYQPNVETYAKLLQFALEQGSFDGGDQGLLNMYFSDWATKDINKHLPFIYNCVSQAFYSYAPAMLFFQKSIKVIHFIGSVKPWHYTIDAHSGQLIIHSDSSHSKEYLEHWWAIFMTDTKPLLPENMKFSEETEKKEYISETTDDITEGLCGQMANLDMSSFCSDVTGTFSPKNHQQSWEHGIIDYRGLDRFENIKQHLDSKLAGKKK